jgi:hypothetical protein
MGRRQEFKNKKLVTVYLEAEELSALDEIRWRDHKGMSDIIRIAISEFIKAHGSGNDTFRLDNWNEDPDFRAVPTILSDGVKWNKYLKDCNPEERSRILKQANIIRSNAISIGNFRKRV